MIPMAMIDDVIVWANTLPGWRGDVVRRLLLAGEQPLTAQDYSEILALAKGELRLCQPPDGLKPLPPAAGKFTACAPAELSVKLLSIDDARNVNIIKSGQKQPFAENGTPVVYGDNGSGKSGYGRLTRNLEMTIGFRFTDFQDVNRARIPRASDSSVSRGDPACRAEHALCHVFGGIPRAEGRRTFLSAFWLSLHCRAL